MRAHSSMVALSRLHKVKGIHQLKVVSMVDCLSFNISKGKATVINPGGNVLILLQGRSSSLQVLIFIDLGILHIALQH